MYPEKEDGKINTLQQKMGVQKQAKVYPTFFDIFTGSQEHENLRHKSSKTKEEQIMCFYSRAHSHTAFSCHLPLVVS